MIAARGGMLALAVFATLAALGATGAALQPSALRVAVTAVVALLAPLLWPGNAASRGRTALRIVVWSSAAACLAAVALRILGNPMQPWSRIFGICMLLMPILLVTHTLCARLEWHWRVRSGNAETAREMAGRTTAFMLAALGSLPLWFGPAAQLLSARHAWIVDAALGVSPLIHLAVGSDNDLLRNEWFYQHSNLAAMQVSYPELATTAWSYASICLLLALGALVSWRLRGSAAAHAHPTLEKSR